MLDRAELRLVMTAHPTEARRRTTIDKLARVFGILRDLDQVATADRDDARRRLAATVQELWGSDDLRAASISVEDEVRGGLIHFASTLADAVPRIYRDLEQALAESYPDQSIECRRCSASAPGSAVIATAIRSSLRRRPSRPWR